MKDLLSYLTPARVSSELLGTAISQADILANKYRTQLPDDVGIAWREQLRPALVRWIGSLTSQEKPR